METEGVCLNAIVVLERFLSSAMQVLVVEAVTAAAKSVSLLSFLLVEIEEITMEAFLNEAWSNIRSIKTTEEMGTLPNAGITLPQEPDTFEEGFPFPGLQSVKRPGPENKDAGEDDEDEDDDEEAGDDGDEGEGEGEDAGDDDGAGKYDDDGDLEDDPEANGGGEAGDEDGEEEDEEEEVEDDDDGGDEEEEEEEEDEDEDEEEEDAEDEDDEEQPPAKKRKGE